MKCNLNEVKMKFNNILAWWLTSIIMLFWAVVILEIPDNGFAREIATALIAPFTLIVQYYFRKKINDNEGK